MLSYKKCKLLVKILVIKTFFLLSVASNCPALRLRSGTGQLPTTILITITMGTIGNQLRITSYQLPVTNYELPVTKDQGLTTLLFVSLAIIVDRLNSLVSVNKHL